ncbi:MAG TPA: PIG-L family deacetylase [Acidimicrobiales bacterium]|nr:PIG-L family deacetylase [Acidimicrobiales bacterium]
MSKALTLMAVCPHPDDECTSAGGALALYHDRGVRTVVVTCTNGELGDGPGGIKPGAPGHDDQAVAATRLQELAEACRILNVDHSERLGYRDSGMSDWDFKGHADAFCNVRVDDAVARLVALMERYEPDVVICDDDQGGYDHPDHLRSHLVTMKAVARSGIPKKVYMPTFGRRTFETLYNALRDLGIEMPFPELDDAALAQMDKAEARITTTLDARAYADQVRRALEAHASQIAESWFAHIPTEAFAASFGQQYFIRAHDTTGAPVPETDLFAGIV